MSITKISAITSLGGALIAGALALAGPAAAAGAGGHDRTRSLPEFGTQTSVLVVDGSAAPSANFSTGTQTSPDLRS